MDSPGRMMGWYPGGGPYSDRSDRSGRSCLSGRPDCFVPDDRFAPNQRVEPPAAFRFLDGQTSILESALHGVRDAASDPAPHRDCHATPAEQTIRDARFVLARHALAVATRPPGGQPLPRRALPPEAASDIAPVQGGWWERRRDPPRLPT